MRLAAADEQLDSDKSKQMRQCINSTERMSQQPAPPGSRDFFVGRWHVDQGASSTDVDWRADGTCLEKNVFAAKNLFSGGAIALDLRNDVCTWEYRQLENGEFEIDFKSAILSDEYPRQLKFRIVSPTRIHNPEMNYDAFRILCPSDEIVALRSAQTGLEAAPRKIRRIARRNWPSQRDTAGSEQPPATKRRRRRKRGACARRRTTRRGRRHGRSEILGATLPRHGLI